MFGKILSGVDRGNEVLAILSLLLALFAMQLGVITHPPFFDETLHIHLTWLISEGRAPHQDFWCQYPVLGYLVTLPLLRLFPETPCAILGLRFFTVLFVAMIGGLLAVHGRRVAKSWLWGIIPFLLVILTPKLADFFYEWSIDFPAALLAVGAMVLLFREPTWLRLGFGTALVLFSVLITPKYAAPLLGALGAYSIYSCRYLRSASKTIGVVFGSALATWGMIWCIYQLGGCSLREDLIWTHLFMYRWTALVEIETVPIRLGETAFFFLIKHWFIGLLVLGGIIGWIITSFRPVRVSAWTGSGILVSLIISLIMLRKYQEQYLAPVMVCLVLFVPHLFLVCRRFRWRGLLTLALLIFALRAALFQIEARADRILRADREVRDPRTESVRGIGKNVPSAIETICVMEELLELTPPGERVVGIWKYHPIFRFDQTFITSDCGRSFSRAIDPSHKVYGYFQPEYFAEELEKAPPAYISLYQVNENYPPGWLEVCISFLKRHRDNYRKIELNGDPIFIRHDLFEREGAEPPS